jgi:hypothetical protein
MKSLVFVTAVALVACVGGGGPLPDQTEQPGSGEKTSPTAEPPADGREGNPAGGEGKPPTDERAGDAGSDGG